METRLESWIQQCGIANYAPTIDAEPDASLCCTETNDWLRRFSILQFSYFIYSMKTRSLKIDLMLIRFFSARSILTWHKLNDFIISILKWMKEKSIAMENVQPHQIRCVSECQWSRNDFPWVQSLNHTFCLFHHFFVSRTMNNLEEY